MILVDKGFGVIFCWRIMIFCLLIYVEKNDYFVWKIRVIFIKMIKLMWRSVIFVE